MAVVGVNMCGEKPGEMVGEEHLIFTLGCLQAKSHLRSILMKNVITTGLCTLMWWFIGNAFMRGTLYCSFALRV